MVTELPESSSDEATRSKLRELYKIAVPADAIARAVAYAIEQPNEVEINEIAIRPTAQDFQDAAKMKVVAAIFTKASGAPRRRPCVQDALGKSILFLRTMRFHSVGGSHE